MSFLKEFKDDLSQAVNELVDEKNAEEKVETIVEEETVDTIGEEGFSLDLEEIGSMINEEAAAEKEAVDEKININIEAAEVEAENAESDIESDEADVDTEETTETTIEAASEDVVFDENDLPSDEVAEITKGTCITGNIESDGSVNLYGRIKGDITCKGKLIVTGRITGVSHAREIFANNAKVEGDVHSSGTIKIGNGSIIVGNVYATSAVIGGAVRGDIDVHGPVIVDGTAVVQGNIKSRSVQINNGAVIEGFCSQCYADIDYKSLFEDTFSEI